MVRPQLISVVAASQSINHHSSIHRRHQDEEEALDDWPVTSNTRLSYDTGPWQQLEGAGSPPPIHSTKPKPVPGSISHDPHGLLHPGPQRWRGLAGRDRLDSWSREPSSPFDGPACHSASTHSKRAVRGQKKSKKGRRRSGLRAFVCLLWLLGSCWAGLLQPFHSPFAICPPGSSSPLYGWLHGSGCSLLSGSLPPIKSSRPVAREPVLKYILKVLPDSVSRVTPCHHFQPPLRRRQQRGWIKTSPSRGPTLRTHIDRRWLQNYKGPWVLLLSIILTRKKQVDGSGLVSFACVFFASFLLPLSHPPCFFLGRSFNCITLTCTRYFTHIYYNNTTKPHACWPLKYLLIYWPMLSCPTLS